LRKIANPLNARRKTKNRQKIFSHPYYGEGSITMASVNGSKTVGTGTTAGKRDDKAPKYLTFEVKDDNGKVWGSFTALPKKFATGSVGYYASDKLMNPDNPGCRYQVGIPVTLIGSKG
jgi:hypothetical protein